MNWLLMTAPGKTNPLKSPEATLAEINSIEGPESVVNSAASIVDKCCKQTTHQY